MFVSRLLLPATLVLLPWFTTSSWGQNYSAMQAAYGGAAPAAIQQFSLRNQATRPPSFPDRPGNEYTAMSPDSWGHPATRRNLPQTYYAAPSVTTPTYLEAPSVAATPNYLEAPLVIAEQPESEQQPEFTPLTNTGDHRSGQELPDTTDPASQTAVTNSGDDQPAKFAGDRYAQAQDFPFDGPDSSVLENGGESIFPFTRKQQAAPVAPSELLTGGALLEAPQQVNPSDATILPAPISTLDPPTISNSQDVIFSSTSDAELGLYAKPRSASPTFQSPLMQTQPYPGQQPFQQQTLIQPANQWQHPNGEPSFQPSSAVFQQAPSISQQAPSISQQGFQQHVPNWTSMVQPAQQTLPNFRPDLGHRDAMPTVRKNPILDDGKKFDHEKKKVDYPPFKEIIATGKFFYNAEVNAIRPSFLGNTGLSVDSAEFSESQPFEFATTFAPLIKFGFESQYGPGVELSYFNVTENANTLGATNDGTGSVASIASVTGPGRLSTIGADNVGDTLTADHSFELETFGLNFFKELKFPISRLNGKFGFVYANVAQSLLVEVNDAAGALAGELTNTTDFRGYGPQFALEYFRPVGHTPLTLVTSFGGKGLFGRRDQFLSNDAGIVERRFGADEFITVIDFAGGVQLKKLVADGRYWTAKVGYLHQSWLGGGTAVDPQGDFGLSGFTFGIGYNR